MRDLFNIDTATKRKMDNMKLAESSVVQDKGSTFKGHALKMKAPSDIKLAYKKVKLLYPDSDHIMVGYRVKGYSGHHHDGEFGAGPKILKILDDRNSTNVAVFISRVHAGPNLGQRRYMHIEQVVREALDELEKS